MNVYVESNFILELAWMQEEHDSCEKILALCENRQITLVMPAYSFGETYETLGRHQKNRRLLNTALETELKQLKRSHLHKDKIESYQMISVLLESDAEENQSFLQSHRRLLELAEIIPLTKDILLAAQTSPKLNSPQDSIVYASVLQHLHQHNHKPSCFINKNAKDFNDPDVVEELHNNNCKLLFSFNNGYGYIQANIGNNSGTSR
jgi:predicted nucleic acid-binding protein